MKNSIKNLIICALITTFFASCSTDIEEINSANDVTERVDLKITGDQDQYIYEQSMESDASIDLVSFNFLGNPSNSFGFQVQLEANVVLNVAIYDVIAENPWNQVQSPFGVFAAQDINTKRRYAIFEMINSDGETQVFTSSVTNNNFLNIDAFTIQEYDNNNKEILCKISDVKLFNTSNSDNYITINGTFRGAITFE